MRRRGFTLIEILVVVSIIIILIAILLPAIGKARVLARRAETESLMTHLSTSLETYYATFHAYPGPAGPDVTTGAGAGKISGAQNLVLGMSYMMVSPTSLPITNGGNPIALPFGTGFKVYPNYPGNGVTNYGSQRADGNWEQLPSFYDAPLKQLSKPSAGSPATPFALWDKAGVSGAAGSNAFAFPVIVDTFNDGLPILYYRRTPGIEKPGQVMTNLPYSTQNLFPYYLAENIEYTAAPALVSTSGALFNQTTGDMSNLATGSLLSQISVGPAASATARGGFVLISAGADRIYGKVTAGSAPSDDIVKVGGN